MLSRVSLIEKATRLSRNCPVRCGSWFRGVLNETILSVKLWLDGQIKGKTCEEIMAQRLLGHLFKDKKAFANTSREGVGESTIKAFLGDNWSLRRIREALASLRADEKTFDRKAAESMKSAATLSLS